MPLPEQPAPATEVAHFKCGVRRSAEGMLEPDIDLSKFKSARFTYSDDKTVCYVGVVEASAEQLTDMTKDVGVTTGTKAEYELAAGVFAKGSSKLEIVEEEK